MKNSARKRQRKYFSSWVMRFCSDTYWGAYATTTVVKTSGKKIVNRVYLSLLIRQMYAISPGVEFLWTLSTFKKRKDNSSSYVHVLCET